MIRPLAGAGIALLAILGYFQFPGHTWLQQDTQIYEPILEHLWDPTVLTKDILVQRPHVSFTLYDETALALRKVTGLGFKSVLSIEQVLTRALGIAGVYLMATAAGLGAGPAFLVAAIYSLGATIAGPAVLSFEIEPDPRGFAVPLLFLAVGLFAHGRYVGAGMAGAISFLIHPPTVYPFWGVYFCVVLWPCKPEIKRRRLYALAPLLLAIGVLLLASRYQTGVRETQTFFSLLAPSQEELQRMRAPYAWISMWWRTWLVQYLILYLVSLLAYFRIRDRAPFDLRAFLLSLPAIGMLSAPLSYLLLERVKWALLPQLQPMRALLFVTVIAVFSASVAGFRAAGRRRLVESFAWFALAYLVPVNTQVWEFPAWYRSSTVAMLALGACVAGWCTLRAIRWRIVIFAAVAAGAFFLIPSLAEVQMYPHLHTPALAEVSAWARASTPKRSVFLFPDAGKGLAPGIFRSEALRAVYVDWKGGGQVNYLKELGEEWWQRWQATMALPFTSVDAARYRKLGIDYFVVSPRHRMPAAIPVFQNAGFLVYRTAEKP